jgi:ABC-type Mn2+/Zn2+ transport system permease subunit/Mn-dependent DtxR family transcriptional regulator
MNAINLGPAYRNVCDSLGRLLELPSSHIDIAVWTIVVGVVCNVTCAILGCYLVLRRMSLLGDAISHSVLPGLAVGFFLSGSTSIVPMLAGAMVAALIATLLMQTLHTYGNVAADASMGVVYTVMFAVGVILVSQARHVDLDTHCVLYGEIAFTTLDSVRLFGLDVPRSLEWLVPVLAAAVVFVTLFWKELKIVSFDAPLAVSMGINAALIHYLLMAMVTCASVAAFREVGSILVIAMLIVPAATAHLLTDRLARMMLIASGVAALSAVVGYLFAYRLNTNVAGMMAVAAGGQFALAVVFAPRYGLVSKTVSNLRLALRIVAEDLVAAIYRLEERTDGREPLHPRRRECMKFVGGGALARLAVPWLKHRGHLVTLEGDRLSLTDSGRTLARSLVRSHRLWESFLETHFELPPDHLHEPASRIEHFIGPDLQARLEEELEQPGHDPHGREIPQQPADPDAT